MATMKANLYMGNKTMKLTDVEIPEVGYQKVKVKIKYCAVCATDAHVVEHDLFHRPAGFGLGHELSGEIVELGEGMEKYDFKVGDRVVCFPLIYCGKCEFCKRGLTQYCVEKQAARYPGMAEYCVCDVSQIYKIPDDGDYKKYCLVEPMTCAIRGIDIADIKIGQNVALSGAGGIGMILLNMILLQGGANVTVIEPVEGKRKLAQEMGAQYTIDPITENLRERAMEITNGQGFDVILEASGAPAAAAPLLDMVAHCGTVLYFAVFPEEYNLPVNLFNLYNKEIKIKTAFCSSDIVPRAIQLVPRMDMDKIIGKIYPLAEVDKAFADFKKSIYPKILIEC